MLLNAIIKLYRDKSFSSPAKGSKPENIQPCFQQNFSACTKDKNESFILQVPSQSKITKRKLKCELSKP